MNNHTWDTTESDPIADLQAAFLRINQPPDYKAMAEIESRVNMLTDILTKECKSPDEIAAIYEKYGIWPTCP